MDIVYSFSLMLFLIFAGLSMCGANLPQSARVIGGLGGIIAGVILLIGIF